MAPPREHDSGSDPDPDRDPAINGGTEPAWPEVLPVRSASTTALASGSGSGSGGGQVRQALLEAGYTPAQIEVLKSTIAPGIPDEELLLAALDARRRGLDLLAGQMHLIPRRSREGTRWTRQVSIDGYRLIAARTGAYAGSDDTLYAGAVTLRGDGGLEISVPARASKTVWRWHSEAAQRFSFTATARWEEYYPGDGSQGIMWRRMPHVMLGKVAEALALRMAFPAELGGLYVEEELHQQHAAETLEPSPPSPSQRAPRVPPQRRQGQGHAPGQTRVQQVPAGGAITPKQAEALQRLGRVLRRDVPDGLTQQSAGELISVWDRDARALPAWQAQTQQVPRQSSLIEP